MNPTPRGHRDRGAGQGRIWRCLLFALLPVASCADSTSPPRPAAIEVITSDSLLTSLGSSVRLEARVLSGAGEPMPEVRVIWSSGDLRVIEVDSLGMARATGPGTVLVTASAPPANTSLRLVVEQLPSELQVTGGDGQEGEVGEALGEPVAFRLTDPGGSPIVGATVLFEVTLGGGKVPAGERETGEGGVASTAWSLGTDAALPQELTARVGTLTRTVTADALPGSPAALTTILGEEQVGLAGEVLADSLVVSVEDRFGNPVPGVTVRWTVREGGGVFSPEVSQSDATGAVRTSWTPGVGGNEGGAEVEGLPTLLIRSEGLPNGVIVGSVSLAESGDVDAVGATFATSVRGEGIARDGRLGSGGAAGATRIRDGSSAPSGPAPTGDPAAEVRSREWVVRLREAESGVSGYPGGAAGAAATVALRDGFRAAMETLPVLAQQRVRVEGVSPVLRSARIVIPADQEEEAVIESLRRDPRVESVEAMTFFRSDVMEWGGELPTMPVLQVEGPSGFPSGRFFPRQSWNYGMMGIPRAWELTEGNASVIVAVVDDGVRFDHPSIAPNLTDDGYDFVTEWEEGHLPRCGGGTVSNTGDGDGPDPFPEVPVPWGWNSAQQCFQPNPSGGHGLHVAGTVAAAAVGVVGVAPRVRVRPVRVVGTIGLGKSYDVEQRILYAAGLPADDGHGGVVQAPSRAHVINLSLSSPTVDAATSAAVEAALAAGVLVVASAGNTGDSTRRYPASYPGVLSVSALGPDSNLASYSSRGTTIGIAAPGGNVNLHGFFGGGIWSSFWDFSSGDPLIAALQGTSMAAPHVTGAAALLLSHAPGMTADEVKARLTSTAVDLGGPQLYGAGRVDAYRALTDGAGLPSTLHAVLYDAGSGERVSEQEVGAGASFRFGGLPDGEYLIYAGTDDRHDGVTGSPGRIWGARGGAAQPAAIVIEGHGERDGSLTIGLPTESEPNDTPDEANDLPLGGYLYGAVSPATDEDYYSVRIPSPGVYTFETGGRFGLCGFGLESDTILDLLDSTGTVLATNDDVDVESERLCSRISIELQPGVYTLRVRGWGNTPGHYSVRAY